MEKNKGTPVTIHMKTTIKDRGQEEKTEMNAVGHLFSKGESIYITFNEPTDEENNLEVKQTLRYQNDQLTVIRQGAIRMNQQFVLGKETEGMYQSPFGPMAMRTKTKHVNFRWNKEKGEGAIAVRYSLHLQDEQAGDYFLRITIKEVRN